MTRRCGSSATPMRTIASCESSQIAEALRRGEIDGTTIVWREGLGDWMPL